MINSGFENALHEAEFASQVIQGRVSLKFAYSGLASLTHDTLASQASYHEVVGEAELEAECLSNSNKEFKEICELGPGNGVHSSQLLLATQDQIQTARYLALDFSEELLRICTRRISAALPNLETSAQTWDVEKGPTHAVNSWRSGPILFWFIGHTIGNLHNPLQALRHIYLSLQAEDIILVSASLQTTGLASPLDTYRNEIFTAAALKPFRMIGLDLTDSSLALHLDQDGSIVGLVTLPDKATRPPILKDSPHIVECFRSRSFSIEELTRIIELAGFSIIETPTISPSRNNAAFLLRIADSGR